MVLKQRTFQEHGAHPQRVHKAGFSNNGIVCNFMVDASKSRNRQIDGAK